MANFIDFISDVSKNKSLQQSFIEKISEGSATELLQLFNEKGYSVELNECAKLIESKDNLNELLQSQKAAY